MGKNDLKVDISYKSSMGKIKYAGNVVESHNKFEERKKKLTKALLPNNRDSTIVSLKIIPE